VFQKISCRAVVDVSHKMKQWFEIFANLVSLISAAEVAEALIKSG
jgi:hypothetical protein